MNQYGVYNRKHLSWESEMAVGILLINEKIELLSHLFINSFRKKVYWLCLEINHIS